jgi:cytoskeletal protein CcmA (bactofilin family)
MFNQTKTQPLTKVTDSDKNTSASINLIGAGTVIEGEIKCSGDIRIDGTIHGSITSKTKIVIGSTGIIEGDISCANADISGVIKGKISVSELLFLKNTAVITGDIVTGKFIVESGASFTGSCAMGPVIKDFKYGEKPGIVSEPKEKTA